MIITNVHGEELYTKATLESMSGILDRRAQYYQISRFPLAIQIWLYECCGYVRNSVEFWCGNKYPRILRWKITRQLKFEELHEKVYGFPSHELNLRNMSLDDLGEWREK